MVVQFTEQKLLRYHAVDYVYILSENDIANSWKDNRGSRKCAEKNIDPHVGRACLSGLCGQDH